MLIVENLTKVFNTKGGVEVRALDKVSFSLNINSFVTVLGPSGSGKSTLLNILGGMDSATEGSVKVSDREITGFSGRELTAYRRNEIGFVFQFYNLMQNLTALENVSLCESKAAGFCAADALELVGLKHRLKSFPAQLSGGEQQRVAIARAIVKKPKLLLCDEPTGALDSKTGRSIIMLLQKLSKESDCCVVVVTHNSQLACAADRVIKLYDGRLIENTVNKTPQSAEAIDF